MPKQNPIKRIFDLYTSDLSYQEIERLVKRDAAEVYEFFAREIPKSVLPLSKWDCPFQTQAMERGYQGL